MKNTSKFATMMIIAETILLSLLLSGCGGGGGGRGVVITAPSLLPIGAGLAFIGLGIVLAAIIHLLGGGKE